MSNKGRFAIVDEQVWLDTSLSCADVKVYGVLKLLALKWHQEGSNEFKFYAPQGVIAANAQVSVKTAALSLSNLEKQGYIKRKNRVGLPPIITILPVENRGFVLMTTQAEAEIYERRRKEKDEDLDNIIEFPQNDRHVSVDSTDTYPQNLPTILTTESQSTEQEHEYVNYDDEIATSISSKAEAEQTFKTFWRLYPKSRGNKKETFAIWERMTPEERGAAIKCLKKWLNSKEWSGEPRFIVHSQRFLRQRKWEDGDPTPLEAKPIIDISRLPANSGLRASLTGRVVV